MRILTFLIVILSYGASAKAGLPTTAPAQTVEHEVYSAELQDGTIRIISVETHKIHQGGTKAADDAACFYSRYFRFTLDPKVRTSSQKNSGDDQIRRTLACTCSFGDMIIWDEPSWLGVSYDGKRLAVAYNQFHSCRVLVFSDHGGKLLTDSLPELWSQGLEGSVSQEAKNAEIKFGDASTIDIDAIVTLQGSGNCAFKLREVDGKMSWKQLSGETQKPMPSLKLRK